MDRVEEVCQLAKAMADQLSELEATLQIMQASYQQTINQCSMPEGEKREVLRILQKVSPAGLSSLLERLQQTADRARLLRIEEYSQAAAALAATIYQQSGVAGPSSERTFTNKADGAAAAVREVAHPSLADTKAQYNKYLPKCSLLKVLTEGARTSSPKYDALLWAEVCGYNTKSKESVEATIHHGLGAFIWDNNCTVQEVTRMQHPSKGEVFILKVDQATQGVRPSCMQEITKEWAMWTPKRYPNHVVVEITTSNRVSYTCPFSHPREGWEEITSYLENQYPQGNKKSTIHHRPHHESHNRPPSNPRATTNAKLTTKASR